MSTLVYCILSFGEEELRQSTSDLWMLWQGQAEGMMPKFITFGLISNIFYVVFN